MKRTIALICAVTLFALSFTGCKKTIISDENGVTHVLVMKKGKPVQDEYGNLIEEYEDENGKKVTGPVTFPVVTKSDDNKIRNALIELNVPDGWTFNENIKAFRIQHTGKCETGAEGKCEINIEMQSSKTVDEEYKRKLAAQEAVGIVSGEDNIVTELKEYTTKLFGIETKAFKCRHYDTSTVYYFIFSYQKNTIGINFNLSDNCFGKDFDPESFISENMSLITVPTK